MRPAKASRGRTIQSEGRQMATTLTGRFDTRREAEMTVERLVQEYKLDRGAISVAAAEEDNSAGNAVAGSDVRAGDPSTEVRDDAPLNGAVQVSVDIEDEALAGRVRSAFREFDADAVREE